MVLFLDTDIILDYLAKREPFDQFAYRIFERASKGQFQLWTSSSSISQIYTILEKYLDTEKAKDILTELLFRIRIKEVDQSVLRLSAQSDFPNFDNAVQYFAAANVAGIDYIITRHLKKYYLGRIRVLSPEQLFQ